MVKILKKFIKCKRVTARRRILLVFYEEKHKYLIWFISYN